VGTDGVLGGVFMVTVKASDQSEDAPWLSLAIALTWYVPASVQLWASVTIVPEATNPAVDVVPSPQSKVYSIVSLSVSFAEVV